jgi:hypothetical protein
LKGRYGGWATRRIGEIAQLPGGGAYLSAVPASPERAAWAAAQVPRHVHDTEPAGRRRPEHGLGRRLPVRPRDECLNINIFWSLAQARVVITDGKEDDNHRRRHSSLGY